MSVEQVTCLLSCFPVHVPPVIFESQVVWERSGRSDLLISSDSRMVLKLSAYDKIFKVCEGVSPNIDTVGDLRGGSIVVDAGKNVDLILALSDQQLLHGGMSLPAAHESHSFATIPEPPLDFSCLPAYGIEAIFLKELHPDPRDESLKFIAETHSYFINGVKTLGSVTGLIHAFCNEFDADAIIQAMRSGRRWPRPGYLRSPIPSSALKLLQSLPTASTLLVAQALS